VTPRLLLAAALAAAAGSSAAAQGTLSTQGFGYPAGPLSARALATGGGVGELDPLSALNPAALTTWGRSGLYAQYGPELRSVEANGQTDQSTVIRFPLIAGAINSGQDWTFGLSFSNLLDRTWETQTTGWYQLQGGDSVAYTQIFKSGGGLNNVRFAAAYRLSNRIRLGLGLHYITGQNSLTVGEQFADSGYATFLQVTTVNATGTAVSAGAEWSPINSLAFGLSGQLGGVMRGRRNDSLVSDARVPGRAGMSVIFAGVAGVVLTADAEWMQWSAMNGLAQSSIQAVDTWDYGIGAEIRLGALAGADTPLRLGWRQRTLPFQADTQTVSETDYSVGVGIPVSQGRGRFDIAIVRALRSADLPVKESAWILNFGILVRP
jgi:hypothetical protein